MRKFDTVEDIPLNHFEQKRVIYGRVEEVLEGDTLCVRHLPGFQVGAQSACTIPADDCDDLEKETILVRLYGVDVPRDQPAIREQALGFTNGKVYHQIVKVTLLQLKTKKKGEVPTLKSANQDVLLSNRHSVAIAMVELLYENDNSRVGTGRKMEGIARQLRDDLALMLARVGLARIRLVGEYREFHNRRGSLDHVVSLAKKEHQGLWENDKINREHNHETCKILMGQRAPHHNKNHLPVSTAINPAA